MERTALPTPEDAGDEKLLSDVQRVGWQVVGIVPEQDEEGPPYAFTVGLFHTFGHPEIVIFGMEPERIWPILNHIGDEVRAGKRFASGVRYLGLIEDYPCAMLNVDPGNYRAYLGTAIWFYRREPFPVLQCVLPDKACWFPWDAACHPTYAALQPLLASEAELKALTG